MNVELGRLKSVIDALGNGAVPSIDITASDEFVLLNARRLVLRIGLGGMAEDTQGSLVWSLAAQDWEAVAELLEPLCEAGSKGGFQWLDGAGRGCSEGLAVLASVSEDGSW